MEPKDRERLKQILKEWGKALIVCVVKSKELRECFDRTTARLDKNKLRISPLNEPEIEIDVNKWDVVDFGAYGTCLAILKPKPKDPKYAEYLAIEIHKPLI